MIDIHVFPEPWGFNPSPFCLKVQTYCRLAKIPHSSTTTLPVGAPKGKLPFITDGKTRLGDSALILDYLKRRYGNPLDAPLHAEQIAMGHLIRRTCEESLYFVLLYSRWIDPVGWRITKPGLFGTLPPGVRDAVAAFARRATRRALRAQGYGRHTAAEIYAFGAADLGALATLLARQPYAVTGFPTSFDATLYAFLVNLLDAPMETELSAEARRHPQFSAYVARLRSEMA